MCTINGMTFRAPPCMLVGKEEGKGLFGRSMCRREGDSIIFYIKHGVKV